MSRSSVLRPVSDALRVIAVITLWLLIFAAMSSVISPWLLLLLVPAMIGVVILNNRSHDEEFDQAIARQRLRGVPLPNPAPSVIDPYRPIPMDRERRIEALATSGGRAITVVFVEDREASWNSYDSEWVHYPHFIAYTTDAPDIGHYVDVDGSRGTRSEDPVADVIRHLRSDVPLRQLTVLARDGHLACLTQPSVRFGLKVERLIEALDTLAERLESRG